MDHSTRHLLRQEKALSLLDQIREHILATSKTVLPRGKAGQVCDYTLALWKKLTCFLDQGDNPTGQRRPRRLTHYLVSVYSSVRQETEKASGPTAVSPQIRRANARCQLFFEIAFATRPLIPASLVLREMRGIPQSILVGS